MEPTDLETPVMREEIFGPILPVIEFGKLDEVYSIVGKNPNPLALYVFSTNAKTSRELVANIPSGGVCINDALSHTMNHRLPFGGRGQSGIGQYHGKYSFETFTHLKSLLVKGFSFDLSLKYPPYKDGHKQMLEISS